MTGARDDSKKPAQDTSKPKPDRPSVDHLFHIVKEGEKPSGQRSDR